MTDSDTDTTEIRLADVDTGETPEARLISYALTIIENAPRCLTSTGIEPHPGFVQGTEMGEWLKARDQWRSEFHAWLDRRKDAPENIEAPNRLTGVLLEAPGVDQTENERLVLHAQTVAANTGQPVRVVRRSMLGGSIDVQIGGFQLRADGAK